MGILPLMLLFYCTSSVFSFTFSRLLRVSTEEYDNARLDSHIDVQEHIECAKRCKWNCKAYLFSTTTNLCQTFSREFCQDSNALVVDPKVLYFTKNNYQSCDDVSTSCPSGVYPVTATSDGNTLKVFCELQSPQGPWIVIHNRQDGRVDFYRGWHQYKQGFGDLNGNFWLGNEIIYKLTTVGYTVLRVELEAWDGSEWYIEYNTFSLSSEMDGYRLTATDTTGNVYDALSYHTGHRFSTFDSDNEIWNCCSCAEAHHGAWWYVECVDSNLNGLYQEDKGDDIADSMLWYKVFNGRFHVPMKKARMMIKKP
ncbi:fibrinogen-like protein A [Argopecten irradians]|uniref:fibrinogen-like protein A n=1 Tax=Argopecten irradians TaxID=31199 RepID=UPI0037156111